LAVEKFYVLLNSFQKVLIALFLGCLEKGRYILEGGLSEMLHACLDVHGFDSDSWFHPRNERFEIIEDLCLV